MPRFIERTGRSTSVGAVPEALGSPAPGEADAAPAQVSICCRHMSAAANRQKRGNADAGTSAFRALRLLGHFPIPLSIRILLRHHRLHCGFSIAVLASSTQARLLPLLP